MDTRTGERYESKEAARSAGVPDAHIVEIRRVTNGPFKGRFYAHAPDGRRWRVDAEGRPWRKGRRR